jgi:ABC-type nickel/cobalt efflux system permease component RcnA
MTLAYPATAHAHPLGNFSLNHHSTLTVRPDGITIDYTLDYAEIPTLQLTPQIDSDGDGALSASEQARYRDAKTADVAQQLVLTIDGVAQPLAAEIGELTFPPGQSGLSTMRLTARFEARVALSTGARVSFRDDNEPDRLGWREIVAIGAGVALADSTFSERDVSDRLRTYPTDVLNAPLRVRSGTFTIGRVDAGVPIRETPAAPRAFGASRFDALFARYLNIDLGAAALLAALVLGALHALEPGHGKSLAAAYLVGARATPGHALLLGASVTLTHTFSVFVMAAVALLLSQFVLPERLFPYLGLASAAIAIAIGGVMLAQAIDQLRAPRADHAHRIDEASSALLHAHGGSQHQHGPTTRSALAIGVSGGLVPCPAALIVLLSAIAAGRITFGVLLVVVFSAGLAIVLSAVCLSVIYGKRLAVQRGWTFAARAPSLLRWSPLLSAGIVLLAGLYALANVLQYLATP